MNITCADPGWRASPALRLAAVIACLLAAWPGVGTGAAAQPRSQAPLKLLSLEDLMEIDVTTPSRRPERMTEAAAAVSVITGEEIRRSGATSLPEALRLVPGLHVARASNRTWAISARGFNITAANKLEVMIDGRSVYTPLFSGVFWDAQRVMLADVDRIEVIRGPGAAMWGANAVNGVINIVTQSAADTQGAHLTLAAGNEEVALGEARYGGRLGTAGHYRVYGRYDQRDEHRFTDGRPAEDPLRNGQAGFRMDWALSPRAAAAVHGDAYLGRLGVFGGSDIDISGGNFVARFDRRAGPHAHLQAKLYYDRAYRLIPDQFEETRDTYDVDIQQRRQAGRHHLVAGAGYRSSAGRTVPSPALFFDPADRTTHLFSAFVEDEIAAARDRLFVAVGSRVEHNSYTGFEVQPMVRARAILPRGQMGWAAVSRAVRMPTRLDTDLRATSGTSAITLRGDPGFRSEEVLAYEGGYRLRPVAGLAVELAAFHNRYDHLRSQELVSPPGPIVLGNTLRGTSSGFEAVVHAELREGLRLRAAYTRLAVDIRRRPGSRDVSGGASEANDPDHQVMLWAFANLPWRLEVDAGLRALSALPDPPVPGYAELDARVGWRVTPSLDLSLIGRNLLPDRHPEFGRPGPDRVEFGRSVYIRLGWWP